METTDLVKLVGSGGAMAALIALLYVVGMRIVRALDRVALKVDEHATADLKSHTEMTAEIANLHGKLDGLVASGHTPPLGVDTERRGHASPRGASTTYSMVRASTKDR